MNARPVRLRCGLLLAVAALIALALSSVPAQADPVLAAAGDIACAPPVSPTAQTCQQASTAREISAAGPDAVASLGDTQYANGTLGEFNALGAFNDTWGAFKSLIHPSVGNHEYGDPAGNASGYFTYFGAQAGTAGQGYYSYDLGAWHIVVLNSDCSGPAGSVSCSNSNTDQGNIDDPQAQWLTTDLAAHPGMCTLAYWHHPLYSSEGTAVAPGMKRAWDALYAAHADVVLNGHAHGYERFKPQNSSGVAYDGSAGHPNNGISEYVVGTGGDDHHSLGPSGLPNSVVLDTTKFGVMFLTLHADGYDFTFKTIGTNGTDGAVRDSGSRACNQATTTTVTAAPNPATTADAITVGADVALTNAGTHPAGTVRFERDGAVLGSVPLDGNGHAQLTLPPQPEGTSTIRAFYSGAAGAIAGASAPVTETVRNPPPVASTPPASDPPPASTPPPATTTPPVPCAQYSGTTKARCKARLARTTGLAACRRRSTAAARAACTRTVAVRYARAILTIDLGTCAKKSTRSARAACSRAARVRYHRAVRTADLAACRVQSTRSRRQACSIRAQTAYRRAIARL